MTRRSYTYYGNWTEIIKLMLSKPVSLREISSQTGVAYETIRPLVNALHEGGVVHISHWRLDSRNRQSIALYKLGFGVDAQKRKPKTTAERSMAYKNRKLIKQERPLQSASVRRVENNNIDMAMRAWGAAA